MQNDYLLKSGVLPKDRLCAETSDLWNLQVNEAFVGDYLKEMIENLFIPHRISVTKFTLNLHYLKANTGEEDDRDRLQGKDSYNFIAPSLRYIERNRIYVENEIPDEFVAAFPEVVKWSMEGESSFVFKDLDDKEERSKIIRSDGFFKWEYLKKIIQCCALVYLGKFTLECRVIEPSMQSQSTLTDFIYYCAAQLSVLSISNMRSYTVYNGIEGGVKLYDKQRICISMRNNRVIMPEAINQILDVGRVVLLHSVEKLEHATVLNFTTILNTDTIIGAMLISDQKIAITELLYGHNVVFENEGWEMKIDDRKIA